ncbi:hypothetical protein ACFLT2_11780, partial [Acidobacteriota bacterium]
GCQSSPDFEALTEELSDIHKKFIEAHLEKNVDFFVQDLSEDYVFVARGEISHPTPKEIRSNMSDYLNNTEFSEYRDTQEPIIGISKDGSLGWSIVRVKVAGKRTMADGSEKDTDFICAWITLFERKGHKWIRLGEVSSFK